METRTDADFRPLSAFLEECAARYYLNCSGIESASDRGSRGDFVTSPEISQVFGEICGLFLAHHYMAAPLRGSACRLVELGPGTGAFMADVLRAVRQVCPEFYDRVGVDLVETSVHLRVRQRARLLEHLEKVAWRNCVEELSVDEPLFVLANEFFDALPIDQLKFSNGSWQQLYVGGGMLTSSFWGPVNLEKRVLEAYLPDKKPSEGDILEVSRHRLDVVEALVSRIDQNGGCALIVDYGFACRSYGESLQAIKGHRPVSLSTDGADISSHVSFEVIRLAAESRSLDTYGPVTQKFFLDSMGLRARTRALQARNPNLSDQIERQYQYLAGDHSCSDPRTMGSLFKVLSFSRV